MKMIKLIKNTALLFVCFMLVCCKPESKPGSIFGTVTDKSSGECVTYAGVELLPKGIKAVTGKDGTYEFKLLEPGEYNILVTKTGYLDLKSNTIVVSSGEQAKGDVQIEKLPPSLQILDNDGNTITELDFGGNEGVVSKTFKLCNRGDASFQFEIYKDVDWIESITPSTGTVPVNGDFPVILKINREKLANGINTTSIIISAPTIGGVELTVKATKGSVPTVITIEPTKISYNSATCGGNVTSDGNSTVVQRGVCYGIAQNPPIFDQTVLGGTGTGLFSCELTGLSPNTKYYVRAYATNDEGTSYGAQKEFTTTDILTTFEYAGTTYYVHPDAGKMNWQTAVDYCEGLSFADYNDWFLPNKEELNAMYVNHEAIGGFVTSGDDCCYWSSQEEFFNNSPYWRYWYQDFSNGEQKYKDGQGYYLRVRPVRKDAGSGTTPTITTNTITDFTSHKAVCGGEITSEGSTSVTQYGVYYSSTSQNPTASDQVEYSNSGTYSFTCNLTGLSANTTYYVRAFATNSAGTSVGEVKNFTTRNEVVELPSANLMVQTEDLGFANWSSANSMCENSTILGHNDWRLPTQAELMVLYNNKDYIGGFNTTSGSNESYYWSSKPFSGVCFATGNLFDGYSTTINHSVRAVRSISGGGGGTAPSAPTGINAEVIGINIKVSWNSVSNADEYSVYWSSNGADYTDFATTSDTYVFDSDPAYNNYYKVKAINSYGESAFSPAVHCIYSPGGGGTAPSAPTGVSAEAIGSQIKVTWNSVSDADSYKVYWSGDGSTFTYEVGSTSNTFILDNEPINGDNYYKVKAINSYGESSLSSPAYCYYSSGGSVNGWLQYDNGIELSALGLTNGGTIYWANMFPTSMLGQYAGTSIVEIEALLNLAGTYTLQIYSGGTSSPGSLVAEISVTHTYSDFGWYTIPLSNAVPLDTSHNLWVVFSKTHAAGQYPAGVCADSGDPNGRWVSNGSGTWEDMGQDQSYTWGIHTYVSSQTKSGKREKVRIISPQIKGTSIPNP